MPLLVVSRRFDVSVGFQRLENVPAYELQKLHGGEVLSFAVPVTFPAIRSAAPEGSDEARAVGSPRVLRKR